MKLSTREDIEAPSATVFEALTRFGDFERAAVRRGAEVRRLSDMEVQGLGAAWNLQFELRGKQRSMDVAVTQFEPSSALAAGMKSSNVVGEMTCTLFELSRTRTRMTLAVEVRPLTLPARLLIQSLKLTKTRMTQKFKDQVAEFAADVEAGYRNQI